MNNVDQLRAEQRQYIASQGGYLNVREADGTYNDLIRDIVTAFLSSYGKAYIGSVNFYGAERIAVANGTMSPLREYHGQILHNFSCDFVIPDYDDKLEKLIRVWNQGNHLTSVVDAITNRVQAIGGEMLIWY